ncbi:MAG: GGDEF domain-containing protein [Acidobacteria bacterium]|nr:GGDEF domain-containing protein [Acidobacteriota bacterium]
MLAVPPQSDSDYVQEPAELRNQVARTLLLRAETIVRDSIAVFPFAGVEEVDAGFSLKLADLILKLITDAALTGQLNPRTLSVNDLRKVASEKAIGIQQLFGLVYVMERAALDESFGAMSEPWPSIAQIVRRSSFDVLSAFSTHLTTEPGDTAIVDPLTTLHTRAVFLAALEKEIQRSERFGHPFAVILLDVDRLADINAKHGYGSGDRVLERIGFTVRNYFREQDWVARYAGDCFAVLLPETHREHAEQLADRIRATVETRLELHDYRSDEQVPVTVSVGVLVAESVDQSVRAEQLLNDVKEAVDRAKEAGRNRLERVDVVLNRPVPPTRDNLPMD